jgi:C4-dicarboxylate-specific signal transduction histidine kinase
VTLSNLQLDGKPYFLMVWEDLTEKRKAQELLELEKAKALQASKMATLGEISANISHEVGNPLMMFITYASSLRRMIESKQINNEKLLEISEKIEKNVNLVTKIIKGLKNFARDGTKDEFEPLFVNQLILESLEFIQSKISTHNIHLNLKLPNHMIEADCRAVQISQVLLNLINNSIDAIQNNSEKWIHIELSENSVYSIITVMDSGLGIPDDMASKIMQPFFTTKEKGKGTGLGLSLSAEIMKDHKGQLLLDSNSKNTKFIIKWPKHLIETEKAA